MTKDDCEKANYEKVGMADAVDGNPPFHRYGTFPLYVDSCQKFGSMDSARARYLRGYNIKRDEMCTPESGRRFGESGRRIDERFCPEDRRSIFLNAYQSGFASYLNRRERDLRKRDEVAGARAKCTFNGDCHLKSSCSLNKCSSSGKACHFDSDCTIEGRCSFGECKY
jgi:hypothetical protein